MRKPPLPVPITSCWSMRLPATYARIGISRGPPRGQRGYRLYQPLMPGPWFRSVSGEEFRRLYMAQLATLEPRQMLQELAALAGDRVPALLCFEKPPPNDAWCHRGLVSAWFADTLKLSVFEYGHEEQGCGWAHPMLPPDWRPSRQRA